ncbi:MAG: NPCBM/NEW2 domain-containing protein [Armatimonadota bacterium]
MSTGTSGWTVPPTDGTIWINWRPFPHSVVGTIHKGQPASTVTYHLGGLYKSFATVAGISQDETDAGATATFEVLADGVSRAVATGGRQTEHLMQCDVTGVNTLEIRARVTSATEDAIDVGWGMALVAEN